MQTTTELKAQRSNRPWFAVRDAAEISGKYKTTWSQERQAEARQIKAYMEMAYSANEFYMNYRKKFIAVKADGALKTPRSDLFEDIVVERGHELVKTPQGVIVRIKR